MFILLQFKEEFYSLIKNTSANIPKGKKNKFFIRRKYLVCGDKEKVKPI